MYRVYRECIKEKRLLYTGKALQSQDNNHMYRMYRIILIKFYVNIDINYTVFFFHFMCILLKVLENSIHLYISVFPRRRADKNAYCLFNKILYIYTQQLVYEEKNIHLAKHSCKTGE